ncbi:MAG: hypothetical protein HDT25_00620 [Ruminococcus sp.]|nr:hypothetical protein [Ruminococcus sp.]
MKKFIIAMSVLLLLCGCEKGAEMPAEISEVSQSVTATATAAEVTTTSETTVTTAETTVTTEETTLMTPLENEYAWLKNVKIDIDKQQAFLYDFTGDGFPERMELILEPYTLTGCISSEVYGWRDNITNIVVGKCLYVCRDSDGKNFIVTCGTNDGMAGMSPFTAVRYDFYADGVYSTVLGETEVYFDGERDYTGICTFLGEDMDSGIGKNGGEILNKKLMEYISEYELIDTITIKYENGRYKASFEADADFTEEYVKDFPEYVETEHYPYIWDKTMYINAKDVNMSDISSFTDIVFVNVFGENLERSDLEFLKDMPSVKYIRLRFTANSVETFIPLTEMTSLEALIDERSDSCMSLLSDEDKARVRELFPNDKYFWSSVK